MDIAALAGQQIAVQRTRACMSQEDLAARIGISRNTLGSIERGQTVPRLDAFLSACQVLDTAPEVLLPGAWDRGTDPRSEELLHQVGALPPWERDMFFRMAGILLDGLHRNYSAL